MFFPELDTGLALLFLLPPLVVTAVEVPLSLEEASDVSSLDPAVTSLCARHDALTGQVEQEGLLTLHTVAPSSIKA